MTTATAHSSDANLQLAVSTVIFALRDNGADRYPDAPPTVCIPLVRRIRQPFEGQWALPGGPLQPDAALTTAAAETLDDATGLRPSYLEQLYAFGTLERSPGPRVVSIVYWALVRSDEAALADTGENVQWFEADALPALAFDHNLIVDYALWRLRNKVEYSRIAHAFLGETFTLAQLRRVHEAILGRRLDAANFRRMIEGSDSVVATGEVVAGRKHRPPRLYRYNAAVDFADNGPLVRLDDAVSTPSAPAASAPSDPVASAPAAAAASTSAASTPAAAAAAAAASTPAAAPVGSA